MFGHLKTLRMKGLSRFELATCGRTFVQELNLIIVTD